MKKTIFNFQTIGLTLTGLCLIVATGCSDNKQAASEESAAAEVEVEENVAVEEESTPMEDTMAQEEDVQVSSAPAQKIQKPENKQPVLTAMSTSYKEWNADGNNILDKDEFYQGLYKVWDKDQNGQIGENEFTDGANNFFADYNFKEYGQYTDWDTDGDGELTVAEFREGMKGTVDQDPTAQELLVIWDTDNDDAIERIELDNITVRLDEDDN